MRDAMSYFRTTMKTTLRVTSLKIQASPVAELKRFGSPPILKAQSADQMVIVESPSGALSHAEMKGDKDIACLFVDRRPAERLAMVITGRADW